MTIQDKIKQVVEALRLCNGIRDALITANTLQADFDALDARLGEVERDRNEWKASTVMAKANAASETLRRCDMQEQLGILQFKYDMLVNQGHNFYSALQAECYLLQAKLDAMQGQEPDYYLDDLAGFHSAKLAKFLNMDLQSMTALYTKPKLAQHEKNSHPCP